MSSSGKASDKAVEQVTVTDDHNSKAVSFGPTENNGDHNQSDNLMNYTNTITAAPDLTIAFETKVTQISENLKETTLAETVANTTEVPSLAEDTGENANVSDAGISIDDVDGKSKKVRFHPDVKANDGGNRIIPKKKKRTKSSNAQSDELGSKSFDEADFEEEQSFDLARTIAQAQDYLNIHPLSFIRSKDRAAGLLKNGLLEESDLLYIAESSDEEDIYEHTHPENGIDRILGKQMKCQKVEFLLRYTGQFNLLWVTEHVVRQQCPKLLKVYERGRENQQDNLMRHVAKRQNLRQRYTDF